MKCPVCKAECHDSFICFNCRFEEVQKVFVNKEDAEEWLERVVLPKRNLYQSNLDDFEIFDKKCWMPGE